jgi:hypothetical protein
VIEHPVTHAQAGGMFWRNTAQWRNRTEDGDALVRHFREVEASGSTETVTWKMRQVAFRKRPG